MKKDNKMKHKNLIIKYICFCIIATLANLSVQRYIIEMNIEKNGFLIAIGLGTIIGLLVKYALDKRWIFFDTINTFRHHQKTLVLFSITGIVTTLIFWCTEIFFWLTFNTHLMREVGAIIGLTIGYFIKYFLDKKFVFKN